jgi:tRNA (guanine37-N1)-methyltransferase
LGVPQVLFSGDHAKIDIWRRRKALEKTWRSRPDLLKNMELTPEDEEILKSIQRKGNDNESD